MKKRNRKTRRRAAVCICVALAAAAVFLAVQGLRHLTRQSADTGEGLKYIRSAETADITKIEQKIEQLEKQGGSGEENVSVKERFNSAVVMGDSIAAGLSENGVLNTSSVVAKIGVHLSETGDQVSQVQKRAPQIIFLAYGMNDVIATDGDTDQFIGEYTALIRELKEKIPDAHIFVNSIFPVQDKAAEDEPALKNIGEYNEALEKMCDKQQIGFIDNTKLAGNGYYEEDGVHFTAAFYPVWAEKMAEVATL